MSDESWKTQQLRDAEAVFEEALSNADRLMAQADEMNASLPEAKLSQEQTDQIEQLVRSGGAPAEIAELQRRIDDGELSWDDVSSGRALADDGVQQAFAAGVPTMRHVKELMDEGHEIGDIIDADPNRPASARDDDDDEPPDSFMEPGKW